MPTKLFVGNLPAACSEDAVRDLFTSYGDIEELAMRNNYAFVHFKTDEDAKNAVRDLNGTKMLGKQIIVEVSTSKRSTGASGPDWRDNPRRDPPRRDHQQNRPYNRPLEHGLAPNLMAGGAMNDVGGILSAVKQLAAVAERERQFGASQVSQVSSLTPLETLTKFTQGTQGAQRNPDPPRDNQVKPDSRNDRSDVEGSSKDNAFVVYERYYIDPSHPLLKGLPIPQLPLIQGNINSDSHSNNTSHNNRQNEYRR